jgi:hypothetical protein
MKILSHRGYWKTAQEKNTVCAFKRSFDLGFGVETDFRDFNGKLVVDHDLPSSESMMAEKFFEVLSSVESTLPLAVNIKADGLQDLLKSAIKRFQIRDYFLFDMSVPDAIVSIKKGLRVFTRQSDVEKQPAYYDQAGGVWVDAFYNDEWINEIIIESHLKAGKTVCLVSPEVHKRSHLNLWNRLKYNQLFKNSNIILCTDMPEDAAAFFKQ